MKPNELTYSEWQARGMRIHKGSKAVGFKDGEAIFNTKQVYDPTIVELSDAEEAYCERAMEWEEPQF